MTFGSFEGLYTFCEVAQIYGLDSSCLRKQVAREKFIVGKDIKKFGRTWVITEQAMVKNFGSLKFEEYKAKFVEKENKVPSKINDKKIKAKRSKAKRSNKSKNSSSMNAKEDKVKDSWVKGDVKGLEMKNFSFDTNTKE